MPKEHGSHPDEHVMGPLPRAGHILSSSVNNILSIIEPRVSDAVTPALDQLAGKGVLRCGVH